MACSGRKDRKQLEALLASMVERIQEIESTRGCPPHKSTLCDWCEFQDVRPLWKHPTKVKPLAPKEFKKDSGVKLVNQLAKFKVERQKIKDSVDGQLEAMDVRIDDVEVDLIELAKREGLEIIQGSQHQAKVKLGTKWKIPGKNDPQREDLVRILHQAGLWDDVSTVDPYALDARLKSGEVDAVTLKQIEHIAPIEETTRVTLSKAESKER